MSQTDEERLVAKIRAFWERHGQAPQVWTELQLVNFCPSDQRTLWVVRSEMVGGRPKVAIVPNPAPVTQKESETSDSVLAAVYQPIFANESLRRSQSLWNQSEARVG